MLLKFSESVVNESSTFSIRSGGYGAGPNYSSIAYITKYLYENNKTLPEVKKLVFSNSGGNEIQTKDLCFVLNTFTPISVEELNFSSWDHDFDGNCDCKFLTRVSKKAVFQLKNVDDKVLETIIKGGYQTEEIDIFASEFAIRKELDFTFDSAFKTKVLNFKSYATYNNLKILACNIHYVK